MPARVQKACRDRLVRRLRKGWYALPGADADVVAAVRAGGALDCFSVLDRAEVWVPSKEVLHIAIPRSSCRASRGCVVHWVLIPHSVDTPVMPLPVAVAHAMQCATAEQRVAIVESALRKRGVRRTALEAAGVPRTVLKQAGTQSESGGESLVRYRMRARGIRFRQQVRISGVGRVDFLVGERLVIEVDGYAFHGDRDAFERDRARDAALIELGYVVLRVSVRQVEHEWERVERALLALIRSRRHYRPRVRKQEPRAARVDSPHGEGRVPVSASVG